MKPAKFHHIQLNVTQINKTAEYYKKYFAVNYNENKKDILLLNTTDNSYFFLNEVQKKPDTHLGTSLWHIGWSGKNGEEEFNWRTNSGIQVHTPINPLREHHWMYFYGPDNEIIEVFTENQHNNFEHIHLLASDVDYTTEWFTKYLGLIPVNENAIPWSNNLFKWNKIILGDVNIMINGKPEQQRTWYPDDGFKPTDTTTIDRIGFSVENIRGVYDNMVKNGADIISELAPNKFINKTSFLVQGPDKLKIEVIEKYPKN